MDRWCNAGIGCGTRPPIGRASRCTAPLLRVWSRKRLTRLLRSGPHSPFQRPP